MAIYGRDFYGLAKYGGDVYVDLQVEPFTAQPNGYNSIRLNWAAPSGSWSRLRLLRSDSGYAVNENDGTVLLDTDTPTKELVDPVPGGQFYYYTLYLNADADATTGVTAGWHRVGVVTGLSVADNGFNQILWDSIPAYFRFLDHAPDGSVLTSYDVRAFSLDSDQNQVNPDLVRFLSVFGWGMSYLDTYAKTLQWANVPDSMHLENLARMAEEMGFEYEYEVPARVMRRHVANQAVLARKRGTLQGLREEIIASTGWDVEFALSDNEFLSQDQANFLNPQYAEWDPAVSYPGPDVGPNLLPNSGMEQSDDVSSIVAYGYNYPYGFPQPSLARVTEADMAVGETVHSGTYALKVSPGLGSEFPPRGGLSFYADNLAGRVPVVSGRSYVFSVWVFFPTANHGLPQPDVNATIRWYGGDGLPLSSGLNVTTTVAAPAAHTWVNLTVEGVAPSDATHAVLDTGFAAGGTDWGSYYYVDDDTFTDQGTPTNVWYNGFIFQTKVPAYGNAQKPDGTGAENTWWRPVTEILDLTVLTTSVGYFNTWDVERSLAFHPAGGPYTTGNIASLELGVSPSVENAVQTSNSNALRLFDSTGDGTYQVTGAVLPIGTDAESGRQRYLAAYEQGLPIPHGTIWDDTTGYTTGDLVVHQGCLYRALRANIARVPSDFTNDWAFVSADIVPPLTLSVYSHMGYTDATGVSLQLNYSTIIDTATFDALWNLGTSMMTYSGLYDTFNSVPGVIGTTGATRTPSSHQIGSTQWSVQDGTWAILEQESLDDLVAGPVNLNNHGGWMEYTTGYSAGLRVAVTFEENSIPGTIHGLCVGAADRLNCYIIGRDSVLDVNGSWAARTTMGSISPPIADGERVIIEYVPGSRIVVYRASGTTHTFPITVTHTTPGTKIALGVLNEVVVGP